MQIRNIQSFPKRSNMPERISTVIAVSGTVGRTADTE